MHIRYYGHMGQTTGFGRAAEDFCLALLGAGVELEVIPLSREATFAGRTLPLARCTDANHDGTRVDAVIVHTLPLDCPTVLARARTSDRDLGALANADTIAYTTWEAFDCPDEVSLPLHQNFDEVWTPSAASARALTVPRAGGFEARVVPHTYDATRTYATASPTRPRGAPFRFYWIGAWMPRKNPDGLIRAFCHAFRPTDEVELVLHSPGTDLLHLITSLAATGLERHELPAILLHNDPLTDEEVHGMHARGDCFVSASRGEAWNLPAFEALLHGKHVIAPAGLGSDDFLSGTETQFVMIARAPAYNAVIHAPVQNALGLGSYSAPISVGAQGLSSQCAWSEPNLLELGSRMRAIYRVCHLGKTPGYPSPTQRIHYDLAARYGYPAVAKLILNRLEALS